MKIFSFRNFRVLVLLVILLAVASQSYHGQAALQSWTVPVRVAVFPVMQASDPLLSDYIQKLSDEQLASINAFFIEQGRRYKINLDPMVRMQFYPAIDQLPPTPPAGDASRWKIMLWSLQMRYWAMQTLSAADGQADLKLVYIVHPPEPGLQLPHSFGLREGHIGVVHGVADQRYRNKNQIVMTHEILHMLGASDKYGADGLPLFPEGYAQPEQQPLYPQQSTEIMAGFRPVTATVKEMPGSLRSCLIGEVTATEINWIPANVGSR